MGLRCLYLASWRRRQAAHGGGVPVAASAGQRCVPCCPCLAAPAAGLPPLPGLKHALPPFLSFSQLCSICLTTGRLSTQVHCLPFRSPPAQKPSRRFWRCCRSTGFCTTGALVDDCMFERSGTRQGVGAGRRVAGDRQARLLHGRGTLGSGVATACRAAAGWSQGSGRSAAAQALANQHHETDQCRCCHAAHPRRLTLPPLPFNGCLPMCSTLMEQGSGYSLSGGPDDRVWPWDMQHGIQINCGWCVGARGCGGRRAAALLLERDPTGVVEPMRGCRASVRKCSLAHGRLAHGCMKGGAL